MAETLFTIPEKDKLAFPDSILKDRKPRIEEGYRETSSKDGTLSITISPDVASRIVAHCKRMDINKTKFVNAEMKRAMDRIENEWLLSLSKEELVEMIISGKDVSDVHD